MVEPDVSTYLQAPSVGQVVSLPLFRPDCSPRLERMTLFHFFVCLFFRFFSFLFFLVLALTLLTLR